MDYKSVLAEQHQQNQSSITHDAKGHQSHTVIFQDSSDGARDPGTLVFDLSKPAAIISFDSIAGKQSPDAAKIWEVGSKLFAQKTLKKCYTGLNLREVVY